MKTLPRALAAILLPTGLCLILLVLWEFLCGAFNAPAWLVPRPTGVLRALCDNLPLLAAHTGRTLLETVWGFLAALVAGIGLALALDAAPILRKAVYPLLVASQTVPIISVAPLVILWFGYGIASKVFIVALVCFFPVTTNLLEGLRSADEGRIRLLRSMGAGGWRVMKWVKLPTALPHLFAGLRIAGTYSVMAAVIGEWLGGSGGLGIYMTRSAKSYLIANVFAAIFVITLLSLAIYGIIEGIARVSVPWHYHRGDGESQ